MSEIIEIKSISVAKQGFTRLAREALKGHEAIAGNAKSHDVGTVSILSTEDLLYLLDTGFRFSVSVDNDEDGYAIVVNEVAIFGYGLTFDQASSDIIENLAEYVNDYLKRIEFFRGIPERRAHYPYLRRLANCNSKEEMAEVVFECYNLHLMTSQGLR